MNQNFIAMTRLNIARCLFIVALLAILVPRQAARLGRRARLAATTTWWSLIAIAMDAIESLRLRYFRREINNPQFSGTLKDYLRLVKDNPRIADPIGLQLHRLIVEGGIDWRRTIAHRLAYNNQSIVCYRVFSSLPAIDAEGIHAIVTQLGDPRATRKLFVISGAAPSGKTVLMRRLEELVEQLGSMPSLTFTKGNANPLRALWLIPAMVQRLAKNDEEPIDRIEARAAVLRSLGFEELLAPKPSRFGRFGKQAAPVTTIEALCQIDDWKELVAAIAKLLGLSQTAVNAMPRIDRIDLETFFRGQTDLADLEVVTTSYRQSVVQGGYGLGSPWFNESELIGERPYMTGFQQGSRAGLLNESNRGMLVIDEAFKLPAEAHRCLLDAAAGEFKSAEYLPTVWDGLMFFVTTDIELQRMFRQDDHRHDRLDRAVFIRLRRSLVLNEVEGLLRQQIDKGRHLIQIEPGLFGYLARYTVLMEVADAVKQPLTAIDSWQEGRQVNLSGIATNDGYRFSVRNMMMAVGQAAFQAYREGAVLSHEMVLSELNARMHHRYDEDGSEQRRHTDAIFRLENWRQFSWHPILKLRGTVHNLAVSARQQWQWLRQTQQVRKILG